MVLLVFFVYFSDGFLSCHDRKWLKETPNNCHYGRIMQVCQILLVKRLPVPRFQRVRNSLVMHWGGRLLRFNPKTCRMRDLWWWLVMQKFADAEAQTGNHCTSFWRIIGASLKKTKQIIQSDSTRCLCVQYKLIIDRILGCLGMWVSCMGHFRLSLQTQLLRCFLPAP